MDIRKQIMCTIPRRKKKALFLPLSTSTTAGRVWCSMVTADLKHAAHERNNYAPQDIIYAGATSVF